MNKLYRWGFWVLLNLLLAGACKRPAPAEILSMVPYLTRENQSWADSLLNTLTPEQKIGQLLLWRPVQPDTSAMIRALEAEQVSGFALEDLRLIQYLALVDSLNGHARRPLFWGAAPEVLLNDLFLDVPYGPHLASVNAGQNDSLRQHLNRLLAKQARALHINLIWSAPAEGNPLKGDFLYAGRTEELNRAGIISIATDFSRFYPDLADSTQRFLDLSVPLRRHIAAGIGGFQIDQMLPLPPKPEDPRQILYRDYFQNKLNFKGILSRPVGRPDEAVLALQHGIDLLVITESPAPYVTAISQALREGLLPADLLDQKVRLILMAKKWMHNGSFHFPAASSNPNALKAAWPTGKPTARLATPLPLDQVYDHFIDSDWEYFNWEIEKSAMTLLNNPKKLIPIEDLASREFRIVAYDGSYYRDFKDQFQGYADFAWRTGEQNPDNRLSRIISGRTNYFNILLLQDRVPHPVRDSLIWDGLRRANQREKLVVINLGPAANLEHFDTSYTIIQGYHRNEATEALSVQLLFGGLRAEGSLPATIGPHWQIRTGETAEKVRLGYGPAKAVGIRPEKLVGIHAIANAATRRRATPGSQVFVAKNGQVVFSEAFGYHTYRRRRPVRKTDLFDVASITKIAASGLMTMHAYEAGRFVPSQRVEEILPDFEESDLGRVRIRDLLIHRSGVQPHLPVLPYLLYREPNNTACDSFFCKEVNDTFNIPVAREFFFQSRYHDTIWQDIQELEIRRRDRFRYSDVNFAMVQKIIEERYEFSLDQLAQRYFYEPLGLRYTQFNPLGNHPLEEIVPTERDDKWRHQQIHGYVHDETAALFGGVAGHAGLFTNAGDLGVILQMLLDKGHYGGRRFLSPETIEFFTRSGHGNHRGLAFDKPHRSNRSGRAYSISGNAYGHTGFTGTCAWVDPEQDLVFVFLSNRVFPSARNRRLFREQIRTRIHEIVYDALDSYTHKWPDLDL